MADYYSVVTEKLRREDEYFFNHQDCLRREYPNSFVAVKDGRVVDSDKDRRELGERIWDKYKTEPVLIRHVDSEQRHVSLRSPKVVRKKE